MKKRLLAFLVVLALLISCVPNGVFAEGAGSTEPESGLEPQAQTTEGTEETNETTAPAEVAPRHDHSPEKHDCAHCDGQVTWTALKNGDVLPTGNGHYYLEEDISVTDWARIVGSEKVVICLNGYTINMSGSARGAFRTDDTAQLYIDDCSAQLDGDGMLVSGGSFTGSRKTSGPGGVIYATEQSKVYVRNVEFIDNDDTAGGGTYFGGGAIHARHDATVVVQSSKFCQNKSVEGGAIGTRGCAQVTVSSCSFQDNTATNDGGAIYICDDATNSEKKLTTVGKAPVLTVTDCVFTGNTAGSYGGAIRTLDDSAYSTKPSVTITGCEFTNDPTKTAAAAGGALYLHEANGSILTNITVTGCTTGKAGGTAIHLSGGGNTVTINGANITGNNCTYGKTDYVGAVFMVNETLVLSGKVVIDDNYVGSGTVERNVIGQNTLTVQVKDLSADSAVSFYSLIAEFPEKPTFLTSTGSTPAWDLGDVVYENNSMAIMYDAENGEFVYLHNTDHIHCACGAHLAADETCQHEAVIGCEHAEKAYIAWDGTGSLTSGSYYLTDNVQLTAQLTVEEGAQVDLCLNGFTITAPADKRVVQIRSGAVLNISDCGAACAEDGTYTAGQLTGGKNPYGGLVNVNRAGTLNLYDGILSNGQAVTTTGSPSGYEGGAIYMQRGNAEQDGGVFNMYGGEISGNQARYGAAIMAAGGVEGKEPTRVNLYGGTISGNTATGNGTVYAQNGTILNLNGTGITGNTAENNGGAVYAVTGSAVSLNGSEITGNTAGSNGGGLHIASSAGSVSVAGDSVVTGNTAGTAANNLYLAGETMLTLGEMGKNASIGISADFEKIPRQISTNTGTLAGLSSDSSYRPLELREGIVYITFSKDHAHCDCGGGESGCDHQITAWVAWDNAAGLPDGGGHYYLVVDVQLSETVPLSSGDLHLCLNGHKVTAASKDEGTKNDRIYSVSGDARLTISDCTARTENGKYVAGTLTGGSSGAIFVPNNTGKTESGEDIVNTVVISLYDGILTGNHISGTGGAVSVRDGAIFNMYGGAISGNTAKTVTDADGKTSGGNGAAVYVGSGAVMNLYGGTVSGNTADNSGAIYVSGSALNMTGGSITGNTAAKNAGGVMLTGAAAVMTMTGGQVSGNTAYGAAGGILLQAKARLELQGGTVSGNQAGSDGGGIYVSNASLKMTGGTVSGNRAPEGYAGGINVFGSTMELTGGKITGNTAANGGGLNVRKSDQGNASALTMTGGEITGNTATGIAGGVFVNNTDTVFTLKNGVISDNYAKGAAGGILLQSRAHLEMTGGQVTGNKSEVDGGGIYVSTNSTMNMTGGTVSGNATKTYGGGINVYGGTLTVTGGEISGNTAANGAGIAARLGVRTVDGKKVRDVAAVLTVKDGKLTGNTASSVGGGVFANGAGAVISLEGGEISGNTAPNGGGVIVQNKAVFQLKGGKVTGNTAPKGGAGVYVSYTASMTVEGGEISKNKTEANGGGIYVLGGTVTLKGGKLSGNHAKSSGGGIYATNFVTKSKITHSSVIDVQGVVISGNTTAGNGAGICTSRATVVNMTSGSVTGNTAQKAAGGMLLQSKSVLNLKGGSVTGNTAVNGAGVYISTDSYIHMYGGSISQNTATGNGAGLYLLRCEAVLAGGAVSGNTTAKSAGGVYVYGAKAKLSGTDITGNVAESNGGGLMSNRYTLTNKTTGEKTHYLPEITVTGGTVSGNSAVNGGGILIQSYSTMTMSGGTVKENTVEKGGAGIYVSSNCTFRMSGGEICGNEAGAHGGGVYHLSSVGEYTGGTIHDNTATGNAGGMVISRKANVSMKDVKLYGNRGKTGGGMVVQSAGSAIHMENCEIYRNTCENNAGGIYVSTDVVDAQFVNVKFYENTAGQSGGAFFAGLRSVISMTDCAVTDNRSEEVGGGLYVRGDLTVTDCVVSGNTAKANGGGIATGQMGATNYFHPDGLVMDNVTVQGNTSGGQGGGLYLNVGSFTTLKNTVIRDNTAQLEGGGLWAIEDTTMHSVSVTGNTSGGEGYAVYLAASEYDGESYFKGVFKISGDMKIHDNTGGDLYIGEQTTVSVAKEGLTDGTRMELKLHSGLLTQTLYGAYDYEGGDLVYTVTAGDRSLTDPEYDAAYNDQFKTQEPETDPTDVTEPAGEEKSQSGVSYIVIGAFAVVIAAVAAILLAAKKKTAKKAETKK